MVVAAPRTEDAQIAHEDAIDDIGASLSDLHRWLVQAAQKGRVTDERRNDFKRRAQRIIDAADKL